MVLTFKTKDCASREHSSPSHREFGQRLIRLRSCEVRIHEERGAKISLFLKPANSKLSAIDRSPRSHVGRDKVPYRKLSMRTWRQLMIMLVIALLPAVSSAENAVFQISLLDGSTINSAIVGIDGNGNINGPQIDRPLNLQDAIAIEREAVPSKKNEGSRAPVQVRLVGGGRVFCQKVTVDADGLTVLSDEPLLGQLPLESVAAIIFRESETAASAIAERSGDKDTVVVNTDDGLKKVSGIFEGIADGKVGLNFKGKSRKIGLEKTTAIILADLKPAAAKGTWTNIELVDGSNVRGVITGWATGELAVDLSAATKITLPVVAVKRIEIESENLVYLSSLVPKSVEQKTIFAFQRTWQTDASIEGNPISLAFGLASGNRVVKQFDKGLGMQSWARIEFANEKEFTHFKATVGIDTETRGRGDCVVEVVSDGITLWSQRITAKDDPVEVDVDISSMDSIALVVDPGEEFDLGDHVDWANARFVKTN